MASSISPQNFMPLYDFICPECGEQRDSFQSMFDAAPECLSCGAQMNKVIGAPSVKMRQYLPSVEQEKAGHTGVQHKPSRTRMFESDVVRKEKKGK